MAEEKIAVDVELWPLLSVAVALFGVIVTIAIFFWNKVSKLEDRLRVVEIGVARLDERTRRPVANAEAEDGALNATWEGVEE